MFKMPNKDRKPYLTSTKRCNSMNLCKTYTNKEVNKVKIYLGHLSGYPKVKTKITTRPNLRHLG